MNRHNILSELEKDMLETNTALKNLSELKAYIEVHATPLEKASILSKPLAVIEKYMTDKYAAQSNQLGINPAANPK